MISDADARSLNGLMAEIVNVPLDTVAFLLDYVQFSFNQATLTMATFPEIGDLKVGGPGYCDALCAQIGVRVAGAVATKDRLTLTFASGALVTVSFDDEDYRGDEAVNFSSRGGSWIAV